MRLGQETLTHIRGILGLLRLLGKGETVDGALRVAVESRRRTLIRECERRGLDYRAVLTAARETKNKASGRKPRPAFDGVKRSQVFDHSPEPGPDPSP